MTIREILMRQDLSLTPSEEKIVRLLLAEYPTSGLGTATSLAKRTGVSDPTVVRLMMKLGFEGFPDFQSKLLAEVESRLHSPLLMMESKRFGRSNDNVVLAYLDSVGEVVDKSASITPLQSYDRATRLLMEARGDVVMLGGRFSRYLAGMFAGYLVQFRPNVRDLGVVSAQTLDTLADLGRKDVLVVFDYRRYQLDVVAYARQAAARGVRILLFTDQWLSPIADLAEVTIVSPLEVASPYDTLVPALAQMEALVARILSTLGDDARARIETLEEVRHANSVTLDSDSQESGVGSARREPGARKSRKSSKQVRS
ncbi:MurR/RpiR family transcriptional regulator [Aquamicrobium terrae]|uniref:DNA-binding MurR/RpiR family transcriptional regulator n=1 Tax=Aquamicrobium terrae TaxID=1324945 RepID=A0ABV2N3A6_9HYPH